MKALAFAFLYLGSLYLVYWRGFAKGVQFTFRRMVSNLVKYQSMDETNALSFVLKIGAPDEREES
jgi:hypothetical protein